MDASGFPSARATRLYRAYGSLAFSFAWVPVMFTAFTRDRGFGTEQYFALWSWYYLAMVAAELPWGAVADRFGPRPLLVAGPAALGAAFLVLGRSASFGACALAMGATGAAHAMISGADSAYLYEALARDGRASTALHEEAVAHRWRFLGVSAADLAGGWVAFVAGTAAAFDLAAALMVAAVVVAARMPAVRAPPRRRPSLRAGLATLASPGAAWVVAWYVAVFALVRLGFQLYQPTLIAAGASDLRLHGATLALLNVVAAGAAVFVPAIHRRLGERGTATAVLLLLATSFAGLPLTGLVGVAPLLCLQQVSFGFLQPVGRTALNHRIPSAERASLLSAQSLLARVTFGLLLTVDGLGGAVDRRLDATYLTLAVAAAGLALLLHRLHPGPPRVAPDA